MISHAKRLAQSKFARNVAIVATGTAGAQAITMAFAPIITRLYGPEAFGVLGAYMAILTLATPIAALTYPIAIVLPKSDQDAIGLAKLCAVLAFIMASVLALLILLFGDGLAELLNLQSIASFLMLIPLAMLFSAFHQILQQWLIRKRQFQITARVAVIQAFTLNSLKTGVGWFHPVGAALIVLSTLGSALHALLLWLSIRQKTEAHPNTEKHPDVMQGQAKSIKELAHQHRDFPIYRAPQVFLDALSQAMPVIMLASFTGPAAAGFYTLGRTILGLPSALVGKAIADVFYPKINEVDHAGGNVSGLITKATAFLGLVGLIPFGVVIVFGPWLFSFVFGSEWAESGEYARWLSVWLFFAFCNRPSVASMPVLKLQGMHLLVNVVGIVLRVIALLVGFIVYDNPLIAIMLYSLVYSAMNITLILLVIVKSRAV